MVGWNHQPDNLTIAMVIQVDPAPKIGDQWTKRLFIEAAERGSWTMLNIIKIESQSLVNQIVNGLV